MHALETADEKDKGRKASQIHKTYQTSPCHCTCVCHMFHTTFGFAVSFVPSIAPDIKVMTDTVSLVTVPMPNHTGT
jgi:hypothetical protein